MSNTTVNHEDSMQTEGKWNQVVGKAKATWADLSDDEIKKTEGNLQKFYGLLQEKYGESVETIRKKLEQ